METKNSNLQKINFAPTIYFVIMFSIAFLMSIVVMIFFRKIFSIFVVFSSLICFLLFTLDYFNSAKLENILVSRSNSKILTYKFENEVEIHVTHNLNYKTEFWVKDGLNSRHFNYSIDEKSKIVTPKTSETFITRLFPNKRGNFTSEFVFVKVRGKFSLCDKIFKIHSPVTFKVYPNLRDLSKYKLIANKKKLSGMGEIRVSKRGFGSEFESLRDYVVGDDYKKINWNATASKRKLIVNQYEADKNNPVFILIDTGRALSYESSGFKKLDYAINAALILADIVNQKGDNAGIMTFNSEVQNIVTPKKGSFHRTYLMETLYNLQTSKDNSNFKKAFNELNMRQKRKSIVFIFTDFQTNSEAAELVNSLPIISKKHLPIIILMKNESLEEIAVDRESKYNDNLRNVYLKAAAIDTILERKKIIQLFNSNGIICVESSAENFALSAVNNYINIKENF